MKKLIILLNIISVLFLTGCINNQTPMIYLNMEVQYVNENSFMGIVTEDSAGVTEGTEANVMYYNVANKDNLNLKIGDIVRIGCTEIQESYPIGIIAKSAQKISNNEENDNQDKITYNAKYIRTNGFYEEVFQEVTVIENKSDLDLYYEQNKELYNFGDKEDNVNEGNINFATAIDAYDDEYFESNILVMVILEEGSGSISHEVKSVRNINDEIKIEIKRDVPDIGTTDMARWHILIEMNKNDYNGEKIKVNKI